MSNTNENLMMLALAKAMQAQSAAGSAAAAADDADRAEAAAEEAMTGTPEGYSNIVGSIASTFSSSKDYAVGDYVLKDSTLYRFTSAHAAGAWTGSDATAVNLGDETSDLKNAVTNAEDAIDSLESAVSAEISRASTAEGLKVNKPVSSPNGTNGQLLRTNGDGTTAWVDQGLPTDAQTATAVAAWLTAHPEATTTVQDGSLTLPKFSDSLKIYTEKDYITPQMYGAKGDGSTDDTTAMQNAINAAISTHKELFLPIGVYKITDKLTVSDAFSIRGINNFKGFGDLNTYSTIKATGNSVFYKASGSVNINIDGVNFQGNGLNILFDVGINSSVITKCKANDFNIIFNKYVGGAHVENNMFLSITGYFMSGAGNVTDSYICNNYINGNNSANAILVNGINVTHTVFSGNFIDYFKYAFYCANNNTYFLYNTIIGNRFDIIWRSFNIIMKHCNITGNMFTNNSASWFVNDPTETSKMNNADAEMLTYRPCCIFCVSDSALGTGGALFVDELTTIMGSTPLEHISIVGNVFNSPLPLYICKTVRELIIQGNVYYTNALREWNNNGGTNDNRINTFSDSDGSILWLDTTSNGMAKQGNSFVDLLDMLVVDNIPRMIYNNKIWKGYYQYRNVFKGSRYIHNEKVYRAKYPGSGYDMKWYDYMGNEE